MMSLSVAVAYAAPRRAFATSVARSGDLAAWVEAGGQSGLAAGDKICRTLAGAAALPNASTYVAWLSTTTTDAYCHVQGKSGLKSSGCGGGALPGGGPWYRTDGVTPFSATLDQLVGSGLVYSPVLTDESGNELPPSDARVWTGTNSSGTAQVWRCLDWSSGAHAENGLTGNALASANSWSADVGYWCDWVGHLLCLEPGASDVPDVQWSPAALAFVSSAKGTGDLGSWPEAGASTGLAAGDAICRSLASAAHLPAPDSFVAWLSSSTTDALSRLPAGKPFRRVDGLKIADSKAALVPDGPPLNSLHVDELGHYLGSDDGVWTGSFADGTRSINHCTDWSSGSSGYGRSGLAAFMNFHWSEYSDVGCSGSYRLYCFSNVITIFWDGFDLTGNFDRWSAHQP